MPFVGRRVPAQFAHGPLLEFEDRARHGLGNGKRVESTSHNRPPLLSTWGGWAWSRYLCVSDSFQPPAGRAGFLGGSAPRGPCLFYAHLDGIADGKEGDRCGSHQEASRRARWFLSKRHKSDTRTLIHRTRARQTRDPRTEQNRAPKTKGTTDEPREGEPRPIWPPFQRGPAARR